MCFFLPKNLFREILISKRKNWGWLIYACAAHMVTSTPHKKREKKMAKIFHSIINGTIEELKHIVEENPRCIRLRDALKNTPLDVAIEHGKLEMAQYLWRMGGRPNLEVYHDGNYTPVHNAAAYGDNTATLKWAFDNGVLSLDVLNIKDYKKCTPLDVAIAYGRPKMVQLFWEKGGQPNLENYRDRNYSPVYCAIYYGFTETLKWVFEHRVLPLSVLQIKGEENMTPLECAIEWNQQEIAALLQKLSREAQTV